MPKPSLGDIASSILDPMLSDNFSLDIPGIPVGGGTTHLLMQCQQATKPGTTINAVEVQLFGHTLEHAGNLTYNHDLSVTYLENRKAQILSTLEAWSEYTKSHDTQHGAYKSEYARDGYLRIYDQKGNTVKTYRIVNMWPSQVPDVQFDGSNSSAITLAVSFKFDYVVDATNGAGG